jgi:hypothetical protein
VKVITAKIAVEGRERWRRLIMKILSIASL